MLTRSTLRAVLSGFLVTALIACSSSPAVLQEKTTGKTARSSEAAAKSKSKADDRVAAEKSVKPGINKRFLSGKLDVGRSKRTFEGESREIFVHRHRITKQVALKPGMAVADIGAGTGLFLELFAKGVGDEGKLFAVEIAPNFVAHLKKRAKDKGIEHVEVVQCSGTSSKLPKSSVDVAFVCDTYHHFEFPKSTLASLHQAIKPGGRLVIVDFERIPGVSRKFILGHVRIGKQKVIEEIVAAGFRYEDEVKVKGLRENYLIRFRR